MRVYVLTNFSGYIRSYSPIIVVGLHLQMMKECGYEPVLLVSDGWNPPADSIFAQVETRKLPAVHVSNTPGMDATFEVDVEFLYQALNEVLPDEAVVITHDLIYLPDYVKHNVAARRLAEERPSIQWLHMIHSATSPRQLIEERTMYGEKYVALLNEKFPNSAILTPNAYSISRLAKQFSYEEHEVFEVPHPADVTEGMEPIVQRIYTEGKLDGPEVLMVYPLRLDRGKNAEMNIRLLGGFKRIGVPAKLVLCDFQSTAGDKVLYREDLKALAENQGVIDDVLFVSELDDAAKMDISHRAVLDMFTLSNVFVMPSKSETYSLVTQEAMMRGNFCVLNHDFAPFRQIFGDNAIYRPFSANIGIDGFEGEINTTYADPNGYFEELAKVATYHVRNEKALKAKTWVRTQRNTKAVFKHYLEPLLYRGRDEPL